MKDLWLFKEAREHFHWWDSVSRHTPVNISTCILYPGSPVCPVQLVGLHAGSRKREVLYCRCVRGRLSNEGVWVGYRRTNFVCRVWHLTGLGRHVGFFSLVFFCFVCFWFCGFF